MARDGVGAHSSICEMKEGKRGLEETTKKCFQMQFSERTSRSANVIEDLSILDIPSSREPAWYSG